MRVGNSVQSYYTKVLHSADKAVRNPKRDSTERDDPLTAALKKKLVQLADSEEEKGGETEGKTEETVDVKDAYEKAVEQNAVKRPMRRLTKAELSALASAQVRPGGQTKVEE